MGELLEPLKPGNPQWSHDVTKAETLDDLGVSKMQSHRWQTAAKLPATMLTVLPITTMISAMKRRNEKYGLRYSGRLPDNFS